jgi:hypothetical protein
MKSDRCSAAVFEKIDALRHEKPIAKFKPLFEHMIRLATDSAERGWCQRAGREIKHAKKVAGYR